MLHSPLERDALEQTIESLERENQRLRELITTLVDEKVRLQTMVAELGKVLWAH